MAEFAHGFRIGRGALRRLPRLHARLPHLRHPRQARQGARAARSSASTAAPASRPARAAPSRPPRARSRSSTASRSRWPSRRRCCSASSRCEVQPEHIVQGLLAAGFDAVWDYGVDMRLVTRAIVDYVDDWHGPRPRDLHHVPGRRAADPGLVSAHARAARSACSPPREIAGREIKRRYSQELGLPPEQIAAIYVTPCQARDGLDPAAGRGRQELPRRLRRHPAAVQQPSWPRRARGRGRARRCRAERPCVRRPCCAGPRAGPSPSCSAPPLPVGHRPAQRDPRLRRRRERQAQGHRLPRVLRVLGRLRQRQPHGGQRLRVAGQAAEPHDRPAGDRPGDGGGGRAALPATTTSRSSAPSSRAARRRRRPARARPPRTRRPSDIAAALPGLDCGLCGAPSCGVLARDVAAGEAGKTDCVFLSGAGWTSCAAAGGGPQEDHQ